MFETMIISELHKQTYFLFLLWQLFKTLLKFLRNGMKANFWWSQTGNFQSSQHLVFESIFILILTSGHEYCVMTESVLSLVQRQSRDRILQKIYGVTSRHEELRCEIRKSLNVQPYFSSE